MDEKKLYYKEDSKNVHKYLTVTSIVVFFGVFSLFPSLINSFKFELSSFFAVLLIFLIWLFILFSAISLLKNAKKIREFYQSDKFWNIKNEIKGRADKCNELNDHIEELKTTFVSSGTKNLGKVEYKDSSNYNFKRKEWEKLKNTDEYVYQCSSTVCKNAQAQPFKYICKYFNIKPNEENLNRIEEVFNNFSAVEEGKKLLTAEEDEIMRKFVGKLPKFIDDKQYPRFKKRLGFKEIDLSDVYYPRFKFLYVSAGGNSSIETNITLDLDNLSNFIEYLSEQIKFKKSIEGQRALMTPKLRAYIKERDNYTCQHCGISIKDEPHLLLEIDHIVPISKGGMTSENNLQTLCWKCNRSKGAKVSS